MRTEELIAELATRAQPVRPLRPPVVRLLAWSLAGVGAAAAGMAAFGTRPHLGELVHQPSFVAMTVLALVTAALAGRSALVLAIPGAERSAALRTVVFGLVGLWAALLVGSIIESGHGLIRAADWPICFVRAVAIALLPGVVLFGMLRRAAPLRLEWTAALAAVAATALAAAAMHFICPLADPGHVLLGHFGPVLVGAGFGAVAAARLLN